MWIWNTIFSKTCASLTCKYIFTLSKTFRALYMKEYWHHFLVSWRLHNSSTQEESELQNQSQTWVDRLLLRPKSAFAVQLLLRFENAFPRELFSTTHKSLICNTSWAWECLPTRVHLLTAVHVLKTDSQCSQGSHLHLKVILRDVLTWVDILTSNSPECTQCIALDMYWCVYRLSTKMH